MNQAIDSLGIPLSFISNPSTGVVSLTGKLARPGLLLYGPTESPTGKATVVYRSESVVSAPAYLETVRGSIVSSDHSFRSVDSGGSGVVTTAAYVDGYVAIDMVLTDPVVITEVRKGTRQLSAGYTYDFDPMPPSAVASAKSEFAEDWSAIHGRLQRANISTPVWIRAKNLVNNHASLVPFGRAGVACAIDSETVMAEETSAGVTIPLEGETEVVAQEKGVTDTATEMMLELLAMVEGLKATLSRAGITFDTQAFATDRAGYMGTILSGLGIQATDAELSHSMDLAKAYCLGMAKAIENAPATTPTAPLIGVAKDESVDESTSEGEVQVTAKTRSAWDRLTGKINTKVTK